MSTITSHVAVLGTSTHHFCAKSRAKALSQKFKIVVKAL